MTFLDLAKARYSARKFKNKAVTETDMNYVLEAGRIAPSAVNYQPWKFLVITDPEVLKEIHTLYHREWFQQAPAVIIVLADKKEAWTRADGKNHADIDASITADHMTLAATDRGLGTCWVCNFDRDKTIKLLNLPDHIEPVVFLPIGYPADVADLQRHENKRKPLDEIVSYNVINW